MVNTRRIFWTVIPFFLVVKACCLATVDPLSKITIQSNRAICSKNKDIRQELIFKYLDDVRVEFADHSTVQAHELEVVCYLKKSEKKIELENIDAQRAKPVMEKQDKALSHFKKITFTGDVVINKDEFKATADSADITIADRVCLLKGNVHIQHKKEKQQDLPVDLKSQVATIKLNSGQILFAGSSRNPVSTVINLENHPIIRNKNSKKGHEFGKEGTIKKA